MVHIKETMTPGVQIVPRGRPREESKQWTGQSGDCCGYATSGADINLI